jgi:hypothetical protein
MHISKVKSPSENRAFFVSDLYLQSDQKEDKSEPALQIIGHVVAESYANKCSMYGRRQFVA